MKLAAWLVALVALALAGCATPRIDQADAGQREVRELQHGWLFRFDNGWDERAAASAPRSAWQEVSVPHSWNRLGEYRLERSPATDDRQGKGWYRLTIDGRGLDPAKRHFIEYDAVGNVTDVWLNGRHLGRHAGAFSRFRFDLNGALDFNGDNLLILRADNSKPEPGSATEHVIPLLGDFFIHGGIYRPARLVSVNRSHISLSDHGGPGVYATSRLAEGGKATIEVRARLTDARPDQILDLKLLEAGGGVVSRARRQVGPCASTGEVMINLPVDRPRLWDGRRDPYLYRVVAALIDAGIAIDRVEQPVGIRTIRIDPAQGFFLNGRHTALHGVSRHQDYQGKGWALTRQDHERDMALIAEMGANSVRFAHYQHAEDWFDLADRYGMLVWAELPFVNKASFGDAPASPELVANARQQMTELVRQNFNHPSVVTWEIGNEVDIDLAFGRLGPRADARPLLRDLNRLSHAEDPSRPTVIADCCEATPGDKVDYLPTLTGEADLMGYNRYFGWYYGKVDDLGPHLDALHAKYPNIPLSVSEYGAGAALSQHVDDPAAHRIDAGGRPHPEEYQSWIHERSWPQLRERRYLWGTWIWNMFDFSSRRKEGDAVDINDKGLVTFDRRVKKDAFYFYKANWSDEPFVHITGRRYAERAHPVNDIRVYSNVPAITATLNGRDLGRTECNGGICVFPQISMPAGVVDIVVRAANDPSISDGVRWTIPDGLQLKRSVAATPK